MSLTTPIPSQREHIPPAMENSAFSDFLTPPFSVVNLPVPLTVGTLKENALGEPMCGSPRRLKSTRNSALASVTVPTVERALAPIAS